MTPTPEQNAKRETPRTDAAEHNASDEPFYSWVYASFARTLETELQQKQKIIENHCKDWAEDDTAIKELCKRCGVADVHPVGDDFKSCVECVEELAHKFIQLRLAADGMAKERNELSRSIEEAHHVAMIDWPGSEVPLLSQVESLFSALKEHYNDKIEALRTVADGLRDSLVECRKDTLFVHARNPQFEEPAKRHAQATAALEAYRAAGEGAPNDTGTSKE